MIRVDNQGFHSLSCNRKNMTKYVFVSGGEVGSTGKGIATASIGRVPESRVISGTLQKLLPGLNIDPVTTSFGDPKFKHDIPVNCPEDRNTGVI